MRVEPDWYGYYTNIPDEPEEDDGDDKYDQWVDDKLCEEVEDEDTEV